MGIFAPDGRGVISFGLMSADQKIKTDLKEQGENFMDVLEADLIAAVRSKDEEMFMFRILER